MARVPGTIVPSASMISSPTRMCWAEAGEFNPTLSITTDLTIGFNGKPAVSGLMWKPYHALSVALAVARETASNIPTVIPCLRIAAANVTQFQPNARQRLLTLGSQRAGVIFCTSRPAPCRQNRTGEDDADAHLKRRIVNREVVVAVTNGKLDLGPWEQIFDSEFDRRRRKRVLVKIIKE